LCCWLGELIRDTRAAQDLENPERKLETAAERGSEKRSAQAKDHDAVSEKARSRAQRAAHARADVRC
jgi:hypothetical protein